MNSVKVGDILVRCLNGFREEIWRSDACVTRVTDTVITCVVLVDVYRTMEFDKQTGINLLGKDYGWLEKD